MHKVLVTGGAGFIGSHLVDRLIEMDYEVTVFDNLSSGSLDNLKKHLENPKFKFVKGDLKDAQTIREHLNDIEVVFHFAANPEVRIGETDPAIHFNENLIATFNLLEAIRKNKTVKTVVFASTSTVYGEALDVPTPENYGPLIPISTYGATKLGCEALICSYAHTFGLRGLLLRFANIIGPRSNHGVVIDFFNKLKSNQRRLEVLGDGSQRKSYLYIKDCIEAIIIAVNSFFENRDVIQVYNIGSLDSITVKMVAKIVAEEMGINDVELLFTGGVDGGRGWFGDIKFMHLSVDKLCNIGWTPRHNSEESVRLTVRELLKNPEGRTIVGSQKW